jgi:hypothetical protein
MQQTIGNKIEAWAIQALRAAATLPFDLQVEAFNSSAETATERIVVKAEIGEKMLEGQKPYAAQLDVSFHTVNRDADEANDVFAKAEASLVAPASSAYVTANFTWLLVMTEAARTTMETRGNFRVFTRTIPLQVASI